MNSPADVRVRRPQEHELLVQQLIQDGAFQTYRDVLIFAAAVGHRAQRRVSFTATAGEPIRYDTLTNSAFSDSLVNMIAAAECPDDAEILDAVRLDERVTIFEEFANGGFEYMQELANVNHKPIHLVVIELVTEALYANRTAEPLSMDELLQGVQWS